MIMAAVMSVMHEQVHRRAGREQEPGQRTEDVSGVFGEKEKSRHTEEAEGDNPDR
jgi:hypothetical protein